MVTSDEFIKQKPETLRKFLNVHTEATQYINTHPEAAIKLMSNKMGDSEKVEKDAKENIKFIASPNSEFIKNTIELVIIQQEMKYITQNISYSQIFDFSYLN